MILKKESYEGKRGDLNDLLMLAVGFDIRIAIDALIEASAVEYALHTDRIENPALCRSMAFRIQLFREFLPEFPVYT